MNPCKCGHLGDPGLACSRAPRCASDYQAKVSGPLLDRIDLHVEVNAVAAADLVLPPPAEGSAEVAARVADARARQTMRYNGNGVRPNAGVDGDLLEKVAGPPGPGRLLLAPTPVPSRPPARGSHHGFRGGRSGAYLLES